MKTKPETTILYRPVGLKELELIFQSGMKAFPPRLPEQPLFYPVLNQGYAAQIARDWNTKDAQSGHVGFVLQFEIEKAYADQFERRVVGGKEHEELWIPAAELDTFNSHIKGTIKVVEVFQGPESFVQLDPASKLPRDWHNRALLFEGRHLKLCAVNGWEYVERCKTSGIVGILAITAEQKILLVEQFRPPLGRRVIEIPAGLAGDIPGSEHEALAVAAQRELLEETGYEAGSMRYLTEGPASAGLSTEIITFFQALDLKKVEAGGGDAGESITVHEVPLGGLEHWLQTKRNEGCLVDYKIYAALGMLRFTP